MKYLAVLYVLVILFISSPLGVVAQWSSDPKDNNPVCTEVFNEIITFGYKLPACTLNVSMPSISISRFTHQSTITKI